MAKTTAAKPEVSDESLGVTRAQLDQLFREFMARVSRIEGELHLHASSSGDVEVKEK